MTMLIHTATKPSLIHRFGVWHLVCASTVAGLLALAAPAAADRACELPAADTGRTCPIAVCIALQDEVNSICKGPPPPRACRNVFGCSLRVAMKQRWLDCYVARSTINVTCWGGGDAGHWERQIDAINQHYACDAEIAKPTTQGGCADPCPWNSSFSGFAAPASLEDVAQCGVAPACLDVDSAPESVAETNPEPEDAQDVVGGR